MIKIFGRFQVKPEGREAYKEGLIGGRKGTPGEPGNLAIRLYEDKQNDDLFFGYLSFTDMEAVAYHRAQPYELNIIELSETKLLAPPDAIILGDPIGGHKLVDRDRSAKAEELVAVALFDFKPGQREKVIAQYEKQIPNVRANDACIEFNAYPVVDSETQLLVVEWWQSPEIARDFSMTDPLSMETGGLLAASLENPIPTYLHELKEMVE